MLVDTAIRNAKPKGKPYKLSDGRGLYLLVNKAGKYFRFDYRFQGKRKTFSLGVYPDVSLAQARNRLNEARKLLADNIDLGEHRKATKAMIANRAINSFEAISREWFEKNKHNWTDRYAKTVITRLEANIFPWLGGEPIAEVTAPELLEALRRIEDWRLHWRQHTELNRYAGRSSDMRLLVGGLNVTQALICVAMFNHSSQKQTLDYLCIQPEEIKDAYMKLEL